MILNYSYCFFHTFTNPFQFSTQLYKKHNFSFRYLFILFSFFHELSCDLRIIVLELKEHNNKIVKKNLQNLENILSSDTNIFQEILKVVLIPDLVSLCLNEAKVKLRSLRMLGAINEMSWEVTCVNVKQLKTEINIVQEVEAKEKYKQLKLIGELPECILV